MPNDPQHREDVYTMDPPGHAPDDPPVDDRPTVEEPDDHSEPDQPGVNLELTDLLDGIDIDVPISANASGDDVGTNTYIDIGVVEGEGNDLPLINIGGEAGGLIDVDGDADGLINVSAHGGEDGASADVGSLINAAVLDMGGVIGLEALAHSDTYDGNVALAGDLSSALGATLDHLTSSSSLFDVPTLDILCGDGLDV